jgi:thiol:disulfide interchange protein
MQKVVPVGLLLWIMLHTSALPADKNAGLWQPWDTVKVQAIANNQPIFIDMYTDWCVYCKVMDATTYRNDSVVSYLKTHYQRFKFNAETKNTLEWRQNFYTFNNRFDVHDFAVYLTRGSIVYPTTIIIAPRGAALL